MKYEEWMVLNWAYLLFQTGETHCIDESLDANITLFQVSKEDLQDWVEMIIRNKLRWYLGMGQEEFERIFIFINKSRLSLSRKLVTSQGDCGLIWRSLDQWVSQESNNQEVVIVKIWSDLQVTLCIYEILIHSSKNISCFVVKRIVRCWNFSQYWRRHQRS